MASRDEYRANEEDEDGDEEVDEMMYKSQRDAVLFAIDISASMLQRPPPSKSRKADTDSPVSAALRCAYQIMQQRIIAQPKDLMGILFFGTEQSKFREDAEHAEDIVDAADVPGLLPLDGASYPNCYLFMDLGVPAAEDVRALKSLAEDDEDPDGVLVPASDSSEDPVSMANVLFCANQIFTTAAPNISSRRLFLITDNDRPHDDDKAARTAAAVRAKDLYDLGVSIELFPILRAKKTFDPALFYDDIIYRDPAAEAGQYNRMMTARAGDGLTLLAALVSTISSKQTPKRAYFSNLRFEVAPGLCISIKGYVLLNRQKAARTCYVWLGGERPLLAKGETVRVDASSARTVDTAEVKRAYRFGGEFVYFTPDELKTLKQWPFPADWKGKGLRIIGFKPRPFLPAWASVKRATFIYPSEEDYIGSTRVFSALWQTLRRTGKMAIAWFVPRVNANPLLAAILPSGGAEDEGLEDEENSGSALNPMNLPAGLWVYPLPFAEDIRKTDTDGERLLAPCPPALAEQMRTVVENLYLPKMVYNPAKYPNPALQWHYKILQTLALEEEVPTASEDLTLPKYKAIDKRVGGSLVEIKQALEQEAHALETRRAIKRDADDDDDGGRGSGPSPKKPLVKRVKTEKGSATTMTGAQLRAAVDGGKLSSMTIAVLKEILASKGESTGGKKAELVERIEQWVEGNM